MMRPRLAPWWVASLTLVAVGLLGRIWRRDTAQAATFVVAALLFAYWVFFAGQAVSLYRTLHHVPPRANKNRVTIRALMALVAAIAWACWSCAALWR